MDRGEWRLDLVAAATKALATCVACLDEPDPEVRLKAAKIIMDARTDLAAFDNENDDPKDLSDFSAMSSTDLTQFVRQQLEANTVIDVKTKQ